MSSKRPAKRTPRASTKQSKDALLRAARHSDLQPSGLDKPAIIKKLCLGEPMDVDATADLIDIDVKQFQGSAYEIPYFGIDGNLIEPRFSRWKIVPVKGDPPRKYHQQEQTKPHLYLPPLVPWSKIAGDVRQRIVLTEGEKKAACACMHGINCIGLGGVWSFTSRRWMIETLDEFKLIKWDGREVEICYDSDLYNKLDVHQALSVLADVMTNKGGRVYIRYLPNTGGKVDLDTFLVKYGARDYEKLERREYEASRVLAEFNDDLCYIKKIDSYYSMRDKHIYSGRGGHMTRRFGSIEVPNKVPGKPPVQAIKVWQRWPHMRMVDQLTYAPGRPMIFDGSLNTWKSWGTVPVEGDISAIERIISGFGDETFQAWFWPWLAYPIQHPGAKLHTAPVIWSAKQGTGKSFVGDIMCDIYGANAEVIKSKDLDDGRYTWMYQRQFIVAEEVTNPGDRAAADQLKALITGETIRINEKFVPAFSVPNVANFIFFSNNPDPVYVPPEDRRFAIAESHNDPRDAKLWDEASKWRREGGAAHLHHYLLHEVDTRKFNPKAHAPMTDDKQEMIYESMSSLEQWCVALLADPEGMTINYGNEYASSNGGPPPVYSMLRNGVDVFTCEAIETVLPDELKKSSRKALSHALAKAGVVRIGKGGVCKETKDRKSRRLMAIRNLDFWREHRDSHKKWAANFDGELIVGDFKRKRGRAK